MGRVVTYGGLLLERALLWVPYFSGNVLRVCKDVVVYVIKAI